MSELPPNTLKAKGGRYWRSKTLIAAYLVLGLVIWQASETVRGGGLISKASSRPKIGLTKYGPNHEERLRRDRANADPVKTFFEVAKRGMTEQEIRQMVADFEAIGPKPPMEDNVAALAYGEKLTAWYIKALDDGLSLSYDQKQAVLAHLTYAEEREQMKLSASLPFDHVDLIYLLPQMNLAESLSGGLDDQPWNLCDLTKDQTKLTYKESLIAKHKELVSQMQETLAISPDVSISIYNIQSFLMHDPETGGYVEYPPQATVLACTMFGTVPGGVIDISNTFPLTPDQKLADFRHDYLAQAKLLHPAQLRMALLMKPGFAGMIKYMLDNPSQEK